MVQNSTTCHYLFNLWKPFKPNREMVPLLGWLGFTAGSLPAG